MVRGGSVPSSRLSPHHSRGGVSSTELLERLSKLGALYLGARSRVLPKELEAVAVINGRPVRFTLLAVNQGARGELVLELERRSVESIRGER